MAGHCVSKQVGLPTARFPLAGSLLLGRRARRARFPTCGVVHVAGYSVVWDCDPTSEFFPEAPKGALRPFSVAALLHYSFMVRFGIFCCQQDFLPRFT